MIEGLISGFLGAAAYALLTDALPAIRHAVRRKRITKCPICGNPIDRDNRVGIQPKGEQYHYFCSPGCGNQWIQYRLNKAQEEA